MLHYGRITGTDDAGIEGTWVVELQEDGAPRPHCVLIPVETMPDVVPVWSSELPIGSTSEIDVTADDPGVSALSPYTPKRRHMNGWIGANSGRTRWGAWLDAHTGEKRLGLQRL